MNIEINPAIKMDASEYDVIVKFSDMLEEFCRLTNDCDTCKLCREISKWKDKSNIINKILEHLEYMNILNVESCERCD